MLTETKPIVFTQTRVDLHCHCGEKLQRVPLMFIEAVCQNGHIVWRPLDIELGESPTETRSLMVGL